MAADRGKAQRIAYILGDPSLFPDEFTSWLPRMIERDPNIRLSALQIPALEAVRYIGGSGLPAFAGTWVNYGSGYEDAGYYKDAWGIVHLCGVIKTGTINTLAFTLPGGYRPKKREIFVNVAGADTGFRIDVLATGDVIPVSGTNGYISLSGITFRAYS